MPENKLPTVSFSSYNCLCCQRDTNNSKPIINKKNGMAYTIMLVFMKNGVFMMI